VNYFLVFKFFSDGTLLYTQTVKDVYKEFTQQLKIDKVKKGKFKIIDDKLHVLVTQSKTKYIYEL